MKGYAFIYDKALKFTEHLNFDCGILQLWDLIPTFTYAPHTRFIYIYMVERGMLPQL